MEMETFEWDSDKDRENQLKHGVSFHEAQYAFADVNKIIAHDKNHSHAEERFFYMGMVEGIILTVRFTYRANRIRIIGAGAWRRGDAL